MPNIHLHKSKTNTTDDFRAVGFSRAWPSDSYDPVSLVSFLSTHDLLQLGRPSAENEVVAPHQRLRPGAEEHTTEDAATPTSSAPTRHEADTIRCISLHAAELMLQKVRAMPAIILPIGVSMCVTLQLRHLRTTALPWMLCSTVASPTTLVPPPHHRRRRRALYRITRSSPQ